MPTTEPTSDAAAMEKNTAFQPRKRADARDKFHVTETHRLARKNELPQTARELVEFFQGVSLAVEFHPVEEAA